MKQWTRLDKEVLSRKLVEDALGKEERCLELRERSEGRGNAGAEGV